MGVAGGTLWKGGVKPLPGDGGQKERGGEEESRPPSHQPLCTSGFSAVRVKSQLSFV